MESICGKLLAMAALLDLMSPAAAVTQYNWNSTLTGSQNWQVDGNWDLFGFPNGPLDVANLSGPLSANLGVGLLGPNVTLAGLMLGGTAGAVSTNVGFSNSAFVMQNDDPTFNNGNALIISGGVPGSSNAISAPVRINNERLEFSSASTNNITVESISTTGTSSSLRSFMPPGLKATVNGPVEMYDQPLALNDSPGGEGIGTPGTLEINGSFVGSAALNIGVTAGAQPTPLGTVILRGFSYFTYNGPVTMSRSNIVLANDGALGGWYARAGNPSQAVGFNFLSDDDARSIGTWLELRQWQSIKGEHSLEWSADVFQSNSRGWVNLLPAGKRFKLSAAQFAILDDSNDRTYAFDGTGRTEVTGGLYDEADLSIQPAYDGNLGHYRKTGTGTLIVSGTTSTYHGDTIIEAGVWRFDTGAHLANTREIVSTGGAIGVDTGTFTNAELLSKIDAADTGGLMLTPGEAAASLDFTTGPLANAANMSVAAPETGITYTGTITPANNTYRLGGGTGTLTLPGTNQLTGANDLQLTNGGEVQLTAVNDYTGTTTITGTAFVSRTNQAIADTSNGISTDMYAPTTLTITTLGRFGSNDSMGASSTDPSRLLIQGSTLKYIGGDVKTDRLFTVGTLGATIDSSGPGAPYFESSGPIGIQPAGPGVARTLTFTGTTGGGFVPLIQDAADGGTVGIAKTGSGTWVLRGDNTYGGPTDVQAGMLTILGNHTGGGDYVVAPGATLSGIGSITGAVDVRGTLAPGYNVSMNDLEITGDVVVASGATLAVDLAGSTSDLLAIDGNLDLSASGDMLDVSVLDTLSSSNWVIATYSGLLTGFFDLVTPGYTVDYGTGMNSQIILSLALSGDFDNDGNVDGRDFLLWQRGGSPDPLSTEDLSDWQANYGAGSELAATRIAVPEPCSWPLLLLLWARISGRRCRLLEI